MRMRKQLRFLTGRALREVLHRGQHKRHYASALFSDLLEPWRLMATLLGQEYIHGRERARVEWSKVLRPKRSAEEHWNDKNESLGLSG
jgi:hypothetical protein